MRFPLSSFWCCVWVLVCLHTFGECSKELFGVAYTPFRVFGACPSDEEIWEDLSILKGYSRRVRIYSTECGNLNHILMQQASAGHLSLMLGVWLDNRATDQQEIDTLMALLRQYPNADLYAICVGNEAVLRRTISASRMAQYVLEVKHKVQALASELNNPRLASVPITTMEAFPYPELVAVSDKVGINIHPFFHSDLHSPNHPGEMAGLAAERAMQTYRVMKQAARGKDIIIGEIGWPSHKRPHDPLPASPQIERDFMHKFMAMAGSEHLEYFWFEVFDSKWKLAMFGDRQAPDLHFGMYYGDRRTRKW